MHNLAGHFMLRALQVLALLSAVAATCASQTIPDKLLSSPVRLELDKPTQEVKEGTMVTYTVTLKNAKEQPVTTSNNLQLGIETPTGAKNIEIPAGQSSATFTWRAANPGVMQMTVRSGKLVPATGLLLVTPTPKPRTPGNSQQPQPTPAPPPPVGATAGSNDAAKKRARRGAAPFRIMENTAKAVMEEAPALPQATKIRLYIQPVPVYGNPVDRIWSAQVSVAVLGGSQDSLTPVAKDVNVHFQSSMGQLSPQDIVLSAGQFSNFSKPAQLTVNRPGTGSVLAISSLGSAGPVDIQFLQPPPVELRLSVSDPVLMGSGSSTANVQVCLIDQSGAITSSDQDVPVTLTATGQLALTSLSIQHGLLCSNSTAWTSGPGTADIRAESTGLKADSAGIIFPKFPWYFVWLSAAGGLLGALISGKGDLCSSL